MPRNDDVSDLPLPLVPPGDTARGMAGHRTRDNGARDDGAFGLEALARTLGEAALNMSLLALDGTEEAATNLGPLAAAEATRRLADQITGQVKGLEVALAEVARLTPR